MLRLFIALAAVCSLSTLTTLSDAANVLIVPYMNGSHYFEIEGIGLQLLKRGHRVYVVADERTTFAKGQKFQLVTHTNASAALTFTDKKTSDKVLENSKSGLNWTVLQMIFKTLCVNMLSDKDLFPKLERLKIDIVLLDNYFVPCYFLVPYKLGVPYVAVGSTLSSWYTRLPLLPSVYQTPFGLEMFGFFFCAETAEQWPFVRRLCRLGGVLMNELFLASIESEYLRQYVDFPSIAAIRENASLTLINQGFLVSSPLPTLPHVELVGGLTTKPAEPLESSLDKWMLEADNVAVVSFGTHFAALPEALTAKLFEAFGKLPKYRFLMRFRNSDEALQKIAKPDNVRLLDWLPQNDALGHKSTRLFITHSGNNGIQEAIYHGVPMLCFYVVADQKTNADRVVKKGFGRMLDVMEFSVDQLTRNIVELMENRTYFDRVRKTSRIFRSEKHPAERAADAVEHVLEFGDSHLRPSEALEQSVWEYYMLDVIGAAYTAGAVGIYASIKIAKAVLGCVCRRLGRLRSEKPEKAKQA